MLPILATFVILLVFGIGDMVATKTKAIVSMLFLSSVIFLAGFWTKVLPNTMFDDSTLLLVSGVLVTMLLVHMGTTIKLRDFADQWKTVIIAAAACIAISLGIYFLGGLIVSDRNYVIVGAPILSGGVVATLTMQNAVADYSVELGVFAALVMVVQGFVGYPVCSLCLKSEAKRVRRLVESGEELKGVTAKITSADAVTKKRLIPPLPDKYNGANIIMAKVALVGFLATITANWINGHDRRHRQCLHHQRSDLRAHLRRRVQGTRLPRYRPHGQGRRGRLRSSSSRCPSSPTSPSPRLTWSPAMLWPLLVVVVTGSITFLVISTLVGKIFGVSWQMSCAIGSTCLFGFPGTYIVTNEVVNATAANDQEKQLMLDHMMPKMLIAGMVSVSITSILIAGYMANLLVF